MQVGEQIELPDEPCVEWNIFIRFSFQIDIYSISKNSLSPFITSYILSFIVK